MAKRVLLADDDVVNRQLTTRLLEARGCRVSAVADGLAALARLEHGQFDLVLLDVEMPELDGPRTAARIRAAEGAADAHLPIVALTAHRRTSERDRCLAAGMDGYLTKPIEMEALDRVLAGATPEERPRAPVTEPAADAVDWRRALAAAADDGRLLARLTASARRAAPRQMDALRRALAAADAGSARRAAHTLKGALRIFGAHRARQLAGRLERHAAEHRIEAASDLLDPLAAELESVLGALATGPPNAPIADGE